MVESPLIRPKTPRVFDFFHAPNKKTETGFTWLGLVYERHVYKCFVSQFVIFWSWRRVRPIAMVGRWTRRASGLTRDFRSCGRIADLPEATETYRVTATSKS
jgi:hypothetical protein